MLVLLRFISYVLLAYGTDSGAKGAALYFGICVLSEVIRAECLTTSDEDNNAAQ